MDRRELLKGTGLLMGALMLPAYGRVVAAEVLSTKLDVGFKKKLADVALNAATKGGASYCDVRIGRYLRQFVITRETKVENIVNTESLGAGIRVIANGAWGFAATNDLSEDGVAAAAAQAVGIAKANAKIQTEPVQLAPTPGVGEVSWATPIVRNAMEVPIKQKVDLLMSVNNAALKSGADFIRSIMFLVNEQKYFASTDGSYIDQDIHRIWSPMQITAVDKKTGKFRIRRGLSAPMGMGYEYLDARKDGHIVLPGGATVYSTSYDMHADAIAAAKQARQKLSAPSVKPGKYDLVLDPSHLWLTIHESIGHP
ncbi:MAG: TldD protein, partial [Nevskia sp.]|nr:TldD protein [Nevskia sp.]